MSREILQNIIDNFKVNDFTRFFRAKNDKFQHPNQPMYYENDNFGDGKKLEEITFEDGKLIVCLFRVKQALSERSGKKAQYELGKKILKEIQADAGIFIFYDKFNNFRFSLIYTNYLGRRRDWSTFRRFTYFVSKEQTNKTFFQRIGDGDFSSLAKIKEAFSVEKVTKEFYEDIAHWYFWAIGHCRFPKDAEVENNGKNVAVIRLITRMIFIWFMRERGLISKELFEEKNVQAILKDVDPNSATYYQAVLQNLFFATLSTKKGERKFRDERRFNKGWNKDFGNQYVFRYHGLFVKPKKIKNYFSNIPFLNGGLFECLDDGRNDIYIDGFTERKKEYQPQVPNFLFFSNERNIDLNSYYGTKDKNYKVRGLLNILSSFNFTIDENSTDDADIALDPELLGRVFENLLASFNPETSTTARKATGSYYTPREIVSYMVTESLKEYFKTHLKDVQEIDKKLETLFVSGSDENPFNKTESKKLVDLIESVRIVDPAVGSGAFPMGALNKMVFILNKVDPGNELWKQAQLDATEVIPDPQVRRNAKKQIEEFFKDKNADYGRKLYLIQKCIYGVDIQQIAIEIAKLRFFISLLVDEKIVKEKENWGIEPLPNLDFKIMQGNSLISEFLGIDFDNGQAKQEQVGMLFAEKEDTMTKEFEQKKNEFQDESDKNKKAKLKNEVEDLMIKIFETKVRKQKADYFRQMEEIEKKYATLPNKKTREEIITNEKQKLSQKTGFDLENIEKQLREFMSKNKTKPFFAWKLYFAEVFEKGGFDVVIANPPYIRVQKLDPKETALLKKKYSTATGKFDIYVTFYELGFSISKNKGIVVYISSNAFLRQDYGYGLKKLISQTKPKVKILDFGHNQIFENVSTYTLIFLGTKSENPNLEYFRVNYEPNKTIFDLNSFVFTNSSTYEDLDWNVIILDKVSRKLLPSSRLLSEHSYTRSPLFTGMDKLLMGIYSGNVFDEKIWRYIIKPKDIARHHIQQPTEKVFFPYTRENNNFELFSENEFEINYPLTYLYLLPHKKELLSRKDSGRSFKEIGRPWYALMRVGAPSDYEKEKIITPSVINKPSFAIDNNKYLYPTGGTYGIILKDNSQAHTRYIYAILNSKLSNYYFRVNSAPKRGGYIALSADDLKNFPIKDITAVKQKPFIDLVDKILTMKKKDAEADTSSLEEEIDQLVYKLYGLTPKEIKIVEGNE